MDITFSSSPLEQTNAIVIGVYENLEFSKGAHDLNTRSGEKLRKILEGSYFEGKEEQVELLSGLDNIDAQHVLVLGLGKKGELTETKLTVLGGLITSRLSKTPDQIVDVHLSDLHAKEMKSEEALAHVAAGALLRSWRFDKYRTKEPENKKPKLKKINFVSSKAESSEQHFSKLAAIACGVFETRELVSEPANVLYPEELARRASELKKLGIKVEVLDEKQMRALGMNALLGVGQGSARESQLVIMQWQGADKNEAPVAFIGKGVTFDTGGISIKPAAGMEEMKWDMGGSGVVVGTMKALATRKAKINAVGVIGLVENMPGGNAQRPGDVVKSMSGQTIEVLNTDAEGRLVLADALWYTQDRFKPQFMVDLATLTMAIIIALGHEYAGLFSNNDELANRLQKTGDKIDEKLWRLPLHKVFDKDMDSDIADIQNIQKTARAAGSITAAQFLQRFVNNVPWAHLDIAGTVWSNKDLALSEKGATGYGVRLLDRLIQDYYEAA